MGRRLQVGTSLLLGGFVCCVGFLSAQAPIGKKKVEQPQIDPGGKLRPSFSSLVGLPTNADMERKLKAVGDYIGAKAWKEVTVALQDVLDAPEDFFFPREAGLGTPWASLKAEANRLLGTLPPPGRQTYEVLSGGKASALLKQARQGPNLELLAQVGQRYFHTRAGGEALDLLGTHHLDRGRFLMAALCFERLLGRPDLDQSPALSLFKAALAFQRNGEPDKAAAAWKLLAKAGKDGVALGERRVDLRELQAVFDQPFARPPTMASVGDWKLFRGNASRTGQVAGKLPELDKFKKGWQTRTVESAFARTWLETATTQVLGRGHAIVPGAAPLAAGGKALFRTQAGLHAVDIKTGELLWETTLYNGFDSLAKEAYPHVSNWADKYLAQFPNVLYENEVVGTLSSDGARVYVVEDLSIPPFPNPYTNVHRMGFRGIEPNTPNLAPALEGVVQHNQLAALDLETGKMQWLAGGMDDKAGPLREGFFLGPPLPVGGKLYSLFEKESELRLVCLDPASGAVVFSQPLIQYKKTLLVEAGRRTWAAPLAYDQGILVCPSNSGAVVAVDLLTHSLVWAHAYAEAPKAAPPPVLQPGGKIRVPIRPPLSRIPPKMLSTWKAAGPMIVDGKVILTAPDAGTIQCLSLRDGTLLWKVERQPEDQFVAAIHQDKVVIAGNHQVRALGIKDGNQLWNTAARVLSGQGVLVGNIYYLPVRDMLNQPGNNPTIIGIDLNNGNVVAQTASPGNEPLGNLLYGDGSLLSQTPLAVTRFELK